MTTIDRPWPQEVDLRLLRQSSRLPRTVLLGTLQTFRLTGEIALGVAVGLLASGQRVAWRGRTPRV